MSQFLCESLEYEFANSRKTSKFNGLDGNRILQEGGTLDEIMKDFHNDQIFSVQIPAIRFLAEPSVR